MSILTGALLSMMVSLMKKLADHFGQEISRLTIVVGTFVLCVVYSVLLNNGIITKEMTTECVKVFTAAIAYYEVIVKTLITPALSAIKSNK